MTNCWILLLVFLSSSSSLCRGSEAFDKFDNSIDRSSRLHNRRSRRRNFHQLDHNKNKNNELVEVVVEEDCSSFDSSEEGDSSSSNAVAGNRIVERIWKFSRNRGISVVGGLASRFMGHESITAAKNVKTILESCDDHGVIDIFSKYPPQEILTSVFALSRIQSACQQYDHSSSTTTTNTSSTSSAQRDNKFPDEDLLEDVTRYAPYAAAAYGWTMDLVSGRLHRGDRKALVKMTSLQEDDIISVNWESKTNLPAYFIVRDKERKRIVLSVRGTWSGHDVLTDLCCTSEEYYVGRRHHKAHAGMLAAARGVSSMAEDVVAEELEKNPGYSLLLVGHSLGGSVAAILGNLWTQQFTDLTVYAYGPACTSPENDRMDSSDCQIISVLVEGDPFSRLSLGHVADVSCALAHLCENAELRSTILIRTDKPLEERDVEWCQDAMKEIQTDMVGEKLYPPGRLLFISNRRTSTGFSPNTIHEVSTDFLQTLQVGPRMFDLSRHIPRLYEARLRECQTN